MWSDTDQQYRRKSIVDQWESHCFGVVNSSLLEVQGDKIKARPELLKFELGLIY